MRPYERAYMEKVEVILDFETWDLRRQSREIMWSHRNVGEMCTI